MVVPLLYGNPDNVDGANFPGRTEGRGRLDTLSLATLACRASAKPLRYIQKLSKIITSYQQTCF